MSKVKLMLSDTKTYQMLKKDPTPTYKRQLVGILNRLKQESKITSQQYYDLHPTQENILYCTPKIHKTGAPLRPIVDYIESIGYNTTKALADILTPMLGKTEHHVKNSRHLANFMKDFTIDDDDRFVSHDVVALFTNTPILKL